MAIPDYKTVMLSLLPFLKDKKEHDIGEVVDALAEEFGLSADELQQLLGSGQQTVIRNRAGWARTYLKKAGLIASTRRGFFRITKRGQSVLGSKPDRIDVKFLEKCPEFVAFRELRHERPEEGQDASERTEMLNGHNRQRQRRAAGASVHVASARGSICVALVPILLVCHGERRE